MEKIIVPFLKLSTKFRKSNRVVDVFGTLAEAQSILVFMPEKLEDFGIARKFIDELMADFPAAKFLFVIKQKYQSLLNGNKNYGTIFVSDKDVNFFGLPKKELRQKILATAYDIVIDLNDDFHLPSTYLCLKSRASLKICLDDDRREPFYNFYFRIRPDEKLNNKYKKLIQYLKNKVIAEKSEK
jgi:ADP-heptose:LPS heptosyltransferase